MFSHIYYGLVTSYALYNFLIAKLMACLDLQGAIFMTKDTTVAGLDRRPDSAEWSPFIRLSANPSQMANCITRQRANESLSTAKNRASRPTAAYDF